MTKMPRYFVLIGLIVALAKPTAAEIVNYPNYSVQVSGDFSLLVWVSADLLNAAERPPGFPAGWWPSVKTHAEHLSRTGTNRPAGLADCLPRPTPGPTYLPPSSRLKPLLATYTAFLGSAELALVAEVEAVEPGFMMVGEGEIEPRVRVYVTEVLKDAGGSVSPGDELIYLGTGGRLLLGATDLCAVQDPNRAVPDVGSQVVLTAYSAPGWDSPPGSVRVVMVSTAFALDGETVNLPAGTRFDKRDILLDELRSAAAVATKEQR